MIFIGAPVNFVSRGRPARAAHAISTLSFRAGREELLALGRRIGVRFVRQRYTAYEHIGLLDNRIERALQAGAVHVDWYRLLDMANAKIRRFGIPR